MRKVENAMKIHTKGLRYIFIVTLLVLLQFSNISAAFAASTVTPAKGLEEIIKQKALERQNLKKQPFQQKDKQGVNRFMKPSAFVATEKSAKQPESRRQVNITGSIQKDKTTVKAGSVVIYSLNGEGYGEYTTAITKGVFSLYLPDGEYVLETYYDEATHETVTTSYHFTVVNGKSVPEKLSIVVPTDNVKGFIQQAKNVISRGTVYITSLDVEAPKAYEARILKGQFKLYLPKGQYKVEGYYDDTKRQFVTLSQEFSIKNGKSTPLAIYVPADNVKGTVQKGKQKVNEGEIQFRTKDDSAWYSARIQKGTFSLYMPDGEYETDGYFDEEKQKYVNHAYSFIVKNGKTKPAQLKIQVPEDNVKGQLTKAGQPIQRGFTEFKNIDSERFFEVEIQNGQFSLYMPDGQYEMTGYYNVETGLYVPFTYKFAVVNGKASPAFLNIDIPADNVTGIVSKNGKVIQNGLVAIQDSEQLYSYEANIQNGQFSLYLPDGEYEITGYYDVDRDVFTAFYQSFIVKNGKAEAITVNVPADNVTGTVQKAGQPVQRGVLILHADESGTEKWYRTEIKDGQISLYLPDGTYTTEGYYDMEKGDVIAFRYTFTVKHGTVEPLRIEVPADNVKGIVKKENGTAWGMLQLQAVGDEEELYYVSVNEGSFSLYLPDGTYQAVTYLDMDLLEEIPVNYTFTVSGGKTTPAELEITIPGNKN
jgi:predicted lipoprotein